jgi:hypothetical protein
MYVPFAINSGRQLYFDIWYPYGPLVPYWHAGLFRIFGSHLLVLYAAGIALSSAMIYVLYRITRAFVPLELAFVGAFVFLLQAFQLTLFNYALPYAYPAAYGSLLNATLVLLLLSNVSAPTNVKVFLAGMIAALAALTKVEFGVAAFLSLGVAVVLQGVREASTRPIRRDLLLCAPGAAICFAVYVYLTARSSIRFIFDDNIPILPNAYFRLTVPDWYPDLSLSHIARWTPLVVLQIVLVLFSIVAASKFRSGRPLLFAAVVGIGAAHMIAQLLRSNVPPILRLVARFGRKVAPFLFFNPGMPWLAALLALTALLVCCWRGYTKHAAACALLGTGTLFTVIRMSTSIAPAGYFVFYVPLAYIVWLVVLYRGAIFLRLRIGPGDWKYLAGLLCFGVLELTAQNYRPQLNPEPAKFERGTISTEPSTAKVVKEAVSFTRQASERSEAVVVWPEELAIYFFSDTLAPSRWTVILPGVLPADQQQSYIAELERKRVKYVILTDRVTPEYQKPVFGADYNQEVYQWLITKFHVVRQIGAYNRARNPEGPKLTGALVWDRNQP